MSLDALHVPSFLCWRRVAVKGSAGSLSDRTNQQTRRATLEGVTLHALHALFPFFLRWPRPTSSGGQAPPVSQEGKNAVTSTTVANGHQNDAFCADAGAALSRFSADDRFFTETPGEAWGRDK